MTKTWFESANCLWSNTIAAMTELTVERFQELEEEVWEALVAGDPRADERLLADDFLGVYPSGFANRSAHAGQLSAGPTVESYKISNSRILVLSDEAVLFSYLANYRRPRTEGANAPEAMFVSSLWCHRGTRWVNVFSQDTPVGSDKPQAAAGAGR